MENNERVIGIEYRGSPRQIELARKMLQMIADHPEEGEGESRIEYLTTRQLYERVMGMIAFDDVGNSHKYKNKREC